MIADTLRRLQSGGATILAVPHKTSPYLTLVELNSDGSLSYLDDYTLGSAATHACFSPDGAYLLVGSASGLYSFSHANGSLTHVETETSGGVPVGGVCISPGSDYAAFFGNDWRLPSADYIDGLFYYYSSYMNTSNTTVFQLVSHPVIDYFFATTESDFGGVSSIDVMEYDVYTDGGSVSFSTNHYGRVISVSPDGDYVAVGIFNDATTYGATYVNVYPYNSSTKAFGSLAATINLPKDPSQTWTNYVGGIAFSPDGTKIAVSTVHSNYNDSILVGQIHVLSFTGSALSNYSYNHTLESLPTGLVFSPDGNYLIASMHNANISAVTTKYGIEVFGMTPSVPVTYDYNTTYYVGDLVNEAGTYYECIANSRRNRPPNATYWLPIPAGKLSSISTSAGIGTDGLANDASGDFIHRTIGITPHPIMNS